MQVKIYYADTFGTSRSGLLIQVVSEYRWPLTQVSLYSNLGLKPEFILSNFFQLAIGRGSIKCISVSIM